MAVVGATETRRGARGRTPRGDCGGLWGGQQLHWRERARAWLAAGGAGPASADFNDAGWDR
eukprot:11182216-Lingulodinium_polyedra.AAC.1